MYPFLLLHGLKSSGNSSRLINRRCEWTIREGWSNDQITVTTCTGGLSVVNYSGEITTSFSPSV